MGQRPDELSTLRTNVRSPDDQSSDDFEATTAEARGEIELTRTEMTSTIEAIQDKLDPEVLSEQAKDAAHDVTDYAIREAKEAGREIIDHALTQAREAVRDVTGQAKLAVREATVGKVESMAQSATDTAGGLRQSAMETIKANPVPTALVGIGIGWMLLNRPSGSSTPSRGSQIHGSGSVVKQVHDSASDVVDQVHGAAGEVVAQVQEAGGQVVDQAHEQASRAQSFLQRQLDDNPLIVAAVAVAVGGMLAGTVRSTSREDQLLGEARDRVMEAAQEVTSATAQKVGRVVDQAQSAATDEARQAFVGHPGGSS